MTNRSAIILTAVILALLLFDYLAFDSEIALFLAKKFMELTDYIAFWR